MKILYDYQLNQATSTPKNPIEFEMRRHNNSSSRPPNDILQLNMDAHDLSDDHCGLGLVLRKEDEAALERQLGFERAQIMRCSLKLRVFEKLWI
jgi:hypothetical protein